MVDLLALAERVGEDATLRGEHPAIRLELLIRVRRGIAGPVSSPEDWDPPLRVEGRLAPVRDRWGGDVPAPDPRRLPSAVSDAAAVLRDWLVECGDVRAASAIPSMGYHGYCLGRVGWWVVEHASVADPTGAALYAAALVRP